MNGINSKKYFYNEKGVSLIELVVAVSIFAMVVIAASGIFINAMKAQKAISAKQNVAGNMRYVMEFMVKEIRMAQVDNAVPSMTFNDGANPVNDGHFLKISFKNGFGNVVTYEFDNGNKKILRNNEPLSSDEVLITGLDFKINAWDIAAGPSPLITIFMKAESKNGVGGEMDLQTSVSPRTY